ncbi:S8 family peptidase [Terribacillus saccharophilus]|uniref:S8 family peptidase n=1 Tax=Terribacillus saccharophilus TaxID=361277 RepID=UPI003981E836
MNKNLVKQGTLALLLAGVLSQLPTVHVYAKEEEKQMIVVYENEQGEKAVEASDAAIEEQYDHLSAAAIAADEATIDELAKDPDIKYVEPDTKIRIAESSAVQPVETTTSEQWNLAGIGASAAWQDGLTGKGVKIAIMDSGIAAHPDLQIAGGISTVDYTASYEDDEGHGTHVAGIIGAKHDGQGTDGIAPDADLFAVKVLDDTGEGYLSDFLEGIDWSIANDMDIINLSMGTAEKSDALEESMQKAYQAGVLLVAASGNEGAGYPVDYPAAYEPVIAVSATDSENNIAHFSSVGDQVEFSAPGTNIKSTLPGSDYGMISGTSQATSHVSAMLAILKQQFPTDSNEQLRVRLQQYTNDLGQQGRDQLFGYGLIHYPVPVKGNELESSDSDGEVTADEKEDKIPVEDLQTLADELKLTITDLADLFAAHGFDLYSYHNLDEVNDVIYRTINDVSVHFLLEEADMTREQLDQQLAAENMTLEDFNTPEELSAYINEFDQHGENVENQAVTAEQGDAIPKKPVTDDQTEPAQASVGTDSDGKVDLGTVQQDDAVKDEENDPGSVQQDEPVKGEEVDLGTVQQDDTAKKEEVESAAVQQIDSDKKDKDESGVEQQTTGTDNKTDDIILTYKSADKEKQDDQEGKQMPDTASPIGNFIAMGIIVAAAGVVLYIRNRRINS